MSSEWTPPTYMHKANSSDTSFLNEKKRITGKMLQKQLKAKQKYKTQQNLINYSKSQNSPRSPRSPRFPKSPRTPKSIKSPRSKTKKQNSKNNIPSPIPNQSEPQTETILQSLANEYESSDSETDHKQQPEYQLVLQSVVEEQLDTEAVIEDIPNTITMNETNHDAHLSPIIVTEFVFDSTEQQSQNDTQTSHIITTSIEQNISSEQDIKTDVKTSIYVESKQEEIPLDLVEDISIELNSDLSGDSEITETETETIINDSELNSLEYKSNQLNSELKLISIISSETEPEMDTETEATIDVEQNEIECNIETYTVDETSFLSILKTLDYKWLDKDENGTISRNYFRYYFKSKIKKQINDKHVLKVFQNISKDGSAYVNVEDVKMWASKMTSWRLEQILMGKLMHKQYSSRNDIPEYIDQTSLLTFLKTINIKTLNNEAGHIKIFDFGLYFNRNYKRQISDIDMFEKIYYDINHNHNGRITNDEYNQWVKQLDQIHLDKLLAMKLTQNNHKWLILILKKLNPKQLDEQNKNVITISSFKQYFKTLNKNIHESIVTKIFYDVDKKHNGTCTIDEYLKWKDCLDDQKLKQIILKK